MVPYRLRLLFWYEEIGGRVVKHQRIQVLHVIGRLGRGGDTSVVLAVLEHLGKLGIHFDFLTHSGCSPETVQRLRKAGCKVYVLSGDMRKMGAVAYFTAVYSFLRQHREYSAVHFHTALQSGIGLFAAWLAGVPIRICHAHAAAIQRKTPVLLRWFAAPVLRGMILVFSNRWVACGEAAGRFLFGGHRFLLLKSAVDLSRFQKPMESAVNRLRDHWNIPSDALLLGQIGRFDLMKNQRFSLSLAAAYARKERPVTLIYVGEGALLGQTMALAEQTKRPGLQVIFAGQRRDIPELLSLFDLLLFPSLAGEGVPITLLEAQAAACPALVSDMVSREADLGLGLLRFLPLEKLSLWEQCLSYRTDLPDAAAVRQRFVQCGYEPQEIAERWIRLYDTKQTI